MDDRVPPSSPPPAGNRLIDALPPRQRRDFIARCEAAPLVAGQTLCEAGQHQDYAWFPLTGFISLATRIDAHAPLELALIGNEGMLGASLAQGVDAAPSGAVVLGAGRALRLTATQLRRALRDSPQLRRVLDRYLYVLAIQLARSAACLGFHKIEPRLARWLLTAHDGAQDDSFHLTHDALAGMLGVRRSSITVAAGALQRSGLIVYVRGAIGILDRAGLEAAACSCYRAMLADYGRTMKPPG